MNLRLIFDQEDGPYMQSFDTKESFESKHSEVKLSGN